MSLRIQLWLIFLLPVLLVGGLVVFGLTIPVPHLGRDYVLDLLLPDADDPVDLPTVYGPPDRSRPLVVIDAGHGGKDPGASGAGLREKTVVLGLAQALKDELLEQGGIRVALTREDDTFLVLDERPEIARRLDADLFISIHADSAGEVSGVSGASIYTLSSEASSEAAARFAERENNADRLNGVEVDGQSDVVSNILVELSQRRVQENSAEFAGLVVREGRGNLRFHPQARRSAALAVLRAPDVPAVLYESGYITNPADAARLSSPEGRKAFAETMARAIRIYFARQS
ncbi:N-acetylmuramoyl-L-alanine amidase family protein [Erythrobacter litoralis]|uniref:N-acetylmuramoyl-L-alanine amidase n=1 Tax=Erythrobacter litoralis (strain HTCC2594) TaxID=314225 RepID=Q2NA46_ERYLH|nr:N-acetylmuramoyl-L-alanine amidase [Erythrobacter litoralis]ABC63445.1 N-acetylmuramoyl-L-alanine amidase [Erythrobacter litoralis HTCC2594]